MRYGYNSETNPFVYVGADCAIETATRKSVSRTVAVMGGGAISCGSRQQEVAALYSTEARCISFSSCAEAFVLIMRIMSDTELVTNIVALTRFTFENLDKVELAANKSVNRRTKLTTARCPYIKSAVTTGHIKLVYLCTEDIAADIMAKPFESVHPKRFSKMCGLLSGKKFKTM